MKHYDVLIATPGSVMDAQYVSSLVSTLEECANRGMTYKFLNARGALIHRVREATCSGGGDVTLNPDHRGPVGDSVSYNKIFWIDSDISWEPWQFFKIYDSDYDVCSGAYLGADAVTVSVHGWDSGGTIPKEVVKQMTEPIKVRSIGFGFVAMKRGVFERMQRPWFKHYLSGIQKSDGTVIHDSMGEDVSWCINAYNSGIDIYFDPTVLVGHVKRTEIKW